MCAPQCLDMDLETYESQIADYSLQDSPFYEASTPMVFDLSISAMNSLMAANGCVASHSGMGGAGAGDAATSNGLTMPSLQTGLLKRSKMMPNPINLSVNNMMRDDPANGNANGATGMKKKRKCVTFLPNYVQVRATHFSISIDLFKLMLDDFNLIEIAHNYWAAYAMGSRQGYHRNESIDRPCS